VNFEARGILSAKPHLTLVAPTTDNRTVTPLRRPNTDYRKREHLTADEVEALMTAAKGNRYGHRDATAILLAYRHGLRACELVDLRWSDVHLTTGTLYVRRGRTASQPRTRCLATNCGHFGVYSVSRRPRRRSSSPASAAHLAEATVSGKEHVHS
jgi:integrase